MGRLTHTVSGSIATVRSPVVAPIESLKVHFSPIQEGTGDPSPSNVRPITGWTGITGYHTGINVFNQEDLLNGYIYAGGGSSSLVENDYFVSTPKIYCANKAVVLVNFKEIPNVSVKLRCKLFSGSSVYTSEYSASNNGDGRTCSGAVLNPSLNVEYIAFSFFTYNNDDLKEKIEDVCVTLYDKMPSDMFYDYIPYSGETIPVTFPNFSTNLFDPTDETFVNISKSNGIYSNSDVDSRTYAQFEIQFYNNATLLSTLSPHNFTETGLMSFDFSINDPLCNLICFKHNGVTKDFRIRFPFTYGNGIYTISCNIISNDPTTVGGLQLSDISIKRGNENVIDYVNNKVYGGYIDLATGDIVAEYGSYIFTGDSADGITYKNDVTHDNIVHHQFNTKIFDRIAEYTSSAYAYSNIARRTGSSSYWVNDLLFYVGTPSFQVSLYIKDSLCEPTAESFNAWLSEHNVHFVYKLATPKLIATLTPQELATFKGYSNFWSNAGDVDVTYQVVESSEMTKERQKIFAGNAPTIHTASGSVANFEMESGLNRSLKSCKVSFLPVQEGSGDPFPPINQNGSIVGVNNTHNESELSSFKIHFSPIQSGSGDPSPTNVRPITGWTNVTGYKGGKNLLDPSTHYTASHYESQGITFDLNSDGSVTINGTVVEGASSSPQFSFYWTQPITGNYYFCANIPYSGTYNEIYMYDNTVGARCRQWDGVSNGLSSHSARPLCEAQLIAGHKISLVIRISRNTGFTYDNVKCSPMLMASNCTDTTFEPYSSPTSYPVSWESQGTVYGGYVDLVSGEVVAEYEILSDTWGNFTKVSGETGDGVTEGRYKRFAHAVYGNGITNHYTDCCNVAKYNYANINGNIHYYIVGTSYNCRVYLPIGTDENLQIQAIGKLVTPIKITTLTSTQIALTTGKSSYWSNADTVTVETLGNVRPINGWRGVNTHSSGKNLLNVNRPYGTPNPTTLLVPTRIMDTEHCYVGSHPDGYYVSYYSSGSVSNGVITVSSFPNNSYGLGFPVPVKGGQKYVFNATSNDGILIGTSYYDRDWKFIKNGGDIYQNMLPNKVLTTPDNAAYILIVFRSAINETYVYSNASFELGENGTSYEPYSGNAYSVEFPLQGKNLFDERYPNIPENTSDVYYRHYYVGDGDVIASSDIPLTSNLYGNLFVLPGKVTTGVSTAINDILIGRSRVRTPVDGYITIAYRNYLNVDPRKYHVMIERAAEGQTTPSEYEPMDALYGGYIDLVTGEVWKSFRKIKLTDISWNNYSGKYIYYCQLAPDPSSLVRKPQSIIYSESISLYKAGQHGTLNPGEFTYKGPGTTPNASGSDKNYIWVRLPYAMETNDMRSWLTSNYPDVYLYYELETPQLVTTLTPTQIQALKGTNNILSDANGIIEVKYWSH